MLTDQIEWHTFLKGFLGPDALVLDLGANKGNFSLEMIRRYGCQCVAVEPSPVVCAAIPNHARLSKFCLAISPVTAPVQFAVSSNTEASHILAPDSGVAHGPMITVSGVRLEQFCSEQGLARINLLKMDIEGQEIAVLSSCSDTFLRSIEQISVEFHDFCGLTALSDIKALIYRLKVLGFWAVRMSGRSYLDTIFINRRRLDLSILSCLWVQLVERNLRGLSRILLRTLTTK